MFWKIIINNILNFSLQLHESKGAHAIVCTYPQHGYFFLGGIFESRGLQVGVNSNAVTQDSWIAGEKVVSSDGC